MPEEQSKVKEHGETEREPNCGTQILVLSPDVGLPPLTSAVLLSLQRIRLTASRFSLEPSDGCSFDYLEVFDGGDDTGSALARHCGENFTRGGINSTSNELFIKFKSDQSVNKQGFALIYIALGGPSTTLLSSGNAGQPASASAGASSCRKNISASTGIINSPSFGRANIYPPRSECNWLLDAGKDKVNAYLLHVDVISRSVLFFRKYLTYHFIKLEIITIQPNVNP